MGYSVQYGKDAVFWLVAVLAACVLALGFPSERSVMGSLPPLAAKDLNHKRLQLPADLGAERTLALIGFDRSHAPGVDSWVQGLRLQTEPGITWLRMPVLNDPGNTHHREALEAFLMARYPDRQDRARLVPIFTDRDQFVRAAGLTSARQPHAVVLSRSGEVLARAEGWYSADKAQALLETLAETGQPAH